MIKRISISLAIIILLVSTAYLYFRLTVHPVIENKIYRSAQLSGRSLQSNINKYKFKSIINLRGKEAKKSWYQIENDISKRNNVQLYNVSLSAYKLPVSSELDSLIHVLQTAEKPILIHCQAGSDRSGMASALALSIEKDATLLEMKKQFSWRYFVNPFRDRSSGKLFFSEYEKFLLQNRLRHNRLTLLSWAENQYVDYRGNIEFAIEYANKKHFDRSKHEDRRSAVIEKGLKKILLTGWAFDYRRKLPIKHLNISIGNHSESPVQFTVERPDVAKYYHLSQKGFTDFKFGWTVLINIEGLEKGCYPISLRVENDNEPSRMIEDAEYDLCIK